MIDANLDGQIPDNNVLDMNVIDLPPATIGFRERLKIPEGVEVESFGEEDQDIGTPAQEEEENVTPVRRSQRVRSTPKRHKDYIGGEELDALLGRPKSLSPKARKLKEMKAKYGRN